MVSQPGPLPSLARLPPPAGTRLIRTLKTWQILGLLVLGGTLGTFIALLLSALALTYISQSAALYLAAMFGTVLVAPALGALAAVALLFLRRT